jgi:hypothetical protein
MIYERLNKAQLQTHTPDHDSELTPVMSARQFTIRFLSGLAVLLALIALFNCIVDPFWYFREVEIKGFNAVKTQFEHYERHVKPALLIRDQPEAIILGSSFSEVGFDPTNPLFTDQGKLKSMNFAFAGSPWGMELCDFEFAVTHAPIKRALVGFLPGSLPLEDCAKDYPSIGQVSMAELLLSNTALQASIDTVTQQNRQPGVGIPTREGMYVISHSRNATTDRGFHEMFLNLVKMYRRQNKRNCPHPTTSTSIPGSLAAAPLDLDGLKRLIETARDHNIDLVLYAYPRNAFLMELENQCDDQDSRWQALKQIVELVDLEANQGAHVKAYQFYGYNDITAEPVIRRVTRYWHDSGHYTFEVGNIMLADMYGGTKPEFGRQLRSTDIDEEYQAFLRGRTDYLKRHPEFMLTMQKLLQGD